MLKMLGEDGGTLDDVLEEAIEGMGPAGKELAEQKLDDLIAILRSNGIVRTQSY